MHPEKAQNVLFFVPTLEVGGAERVCLYYVNNLNSYRPVLLLQLKRGPLLSEVRGGVPILGIFEHPIIERKPHRLDRLLWIFGGVTKGIKTILASLVRWSPFKAYRRRLTFFHSAKALMSRTRQRLGQEILTIAYFVISVPSRLRSMLLRWLRKIEPLYYCYSLFWQARRLTVLARQNGCAAVTSFITLPNIIAIFAKLFFDRRLKVIINVHDVTSRILVHSKLKRYERFLLRWLIRLLYPRADLIVAVAEGIKRDLVEQFKIPAEKIAVIYNPIDVQGIRRRAAEPVGHPWLNPKEGPLAVAVGRLVKLKGFDILIRAVAQLPSEVKLIIIGDGEERTALQSLRRELGLTERVALLGFQENPWKYMVRASVFVLPSLTEGLPNVIGEAMALGVPIVATDCSPGVREFLEGGKSGLLVPAGDPAALAKGIARVLGDEGLGQELAQRGRQRVAQFDLPKVIMLYEDVLLRLLHKDRHD